MAKRNSISNSFVPQRRAADSAAACRQRHGRFGSQKPPLKWAVRLKAIFGVGFSVFQDESRLHLFDFRVCASIGELRSPFSLPRRGRGSRNGFTDGYLVALPLSAPPGGSKHRGSLALKHPQQGNDSPAPRIVPGNRHGRSRVCCTVHHEHTSPVPAPTPLFWFEVERTASGISDALSGFSS